VKDQPATTPAAGNIYRHIFAIMVAVEMCLHEIELNLWVTECSIIVIPAKCECIWAILVAGSFQPEYMCMLED
jgi:hypothetical protein